MMNREDIGRELDAMVETGLARTRDTFAAAGLTGDELDLLLASERRRLDAWREQTLDWIMWQAAEPPAPEGTEIRTIAPLAAPTSRLQ